MDYMDCMDKRNIDLLVHNVQAVQLWVLQFKLKVNR